MVCHSEIVFLQLSRIHAVGRHFESKPTVTNRWAGDLWAPAGRVRWRNAPGGRVATSSQLNSCNLAHNLVVTDRPS